MFNPDNDFIEIFNEKEKEEKEKEIEKENEQVKSSDGHKDEEAFDSQNSKKIQDYQVFIGRSHIKDFTPPPKSFI